MSNQPDDRNPQDRALVAAQRGSIATRTDVPNPQGKGQVGFLQHWEYARPRGVVPKASAQVLADYFTALLVLSAEFKFMPSFGQTYYLYRIDSRWQLSLVSPDEWDRPARYRGYVGACVLHDDSTWSIEPSANLGQPGPVSDALSDVYAAFLDRLHSKEPLEESLPWYEARMPYFQRLYAAAMSRSLHDSIGFGGRAGRPAREWLASLPGDALRLLQQDADAG